jgi:hypothetical protein
MEVKASLKIPYERVGYRTTDSARGATHSQKRQRAVKQAELKNPFGAFSAKRRYLGRDYPRRYQS